MELRRITRKSRLKIAILACFREPAPEVSSRLGEFSEREWRGVLRWLDLSGLALYLLDRLTSLGAENCLPKPILLRLQRNLADNRKRTTALFNETVTIAGALKQANISFALLKGITLAPESVSDISLRCQMDIDILIRDTDASAARDILPSFGYALDAVKGLEWSFTAGCDEPMKMESLYQARPQRMVELHLLPASDNRDAALPDDRLARARLRRFQGFDLPALSPPDLFVQQALHIFKHLCSEHTRAQWVLEYWRHVHARRGDPAFWQDVEWIAGREPYADVAIGAANLLATLLFGKRPLPAWMQQSSDRLPPAVRLWIELYGCRVLLTDFPASKFYILLRQQLHTGSSAPRVSRWRSLLPFHWWPASVTRARPGEPLAARLMRYRVEIQCVLRRLQFHIRTSVPFAIELLRWQRIAADRNR